MTVDEELLLNKVLDKYAEALRRNMTPDVLLRFDALTPNVRRELAIKMLGEQA